MHNIHSRVACAELIDIRAHSTARLSGMRVGIRYLIPGTWYQVLDAKHKYSVPMLGTKYFRITYLVSSTCHDALGTKNLVRKYPILGTKYVLPST